MGLFPRRLPATRFHHSRAVIFCMTSAVRRLMPCDILHPRLSCGRTRTNHVAFVLTGTPPALNCSETVRKPRVTPTTCDVAWHTGMGQGFPDRYCGLFREQKERVPTPRPFRGAGRTAMADIDRRQSRSGSEPGRSGDGTSPRTTGADLPGVAVETDFRTAADDRNDAVRAVVRAVWPAGAVAPAFLTAYQPQAKDRDEGEDPRLRFGLEGFADQCVPPAMPVRTVDPRCTALGTGGASGTRTGVSDTDLQNAPAK
jgi:hypothetical protein